MNTPGMIPDPCMHALMQYWRQHPYASGQTGAEQGQSQETATQPAVERMPGRQNLKDDREGRCRLADAESEGGWRADAAQDTPSRSTATRRCIVAAAFAHGFEFAG